MSRNANWDKAKRQAVGIYRAASPQASINHGTTEYSGGEYRVPDAAKSYYQSKPSPEMLAAVAAFEGKIKFVPAALNSSGRVVIPNDLNAKRSGANPQNRGELLPGGADRAGSRYFVRESVREIEHPTIARARTLRTVSPYAR